MSGWQAIETAPKDGTSFLGWSAIYGYERWWWMPHKIGIEQGWFTSHGAFGDDDEKPTHWMPLPEPPLPEEKEQP